MRPGLGAYDLASLLYDPYVNLADTEREALLVYYLERLDSEVDRERFSRYFLAMCDSAFASPHPARRQKSSAGCLNDSFL
jgi:hypothetical protein